MGPPSVSPVYFDVFKKLCKFLDGSTLKEEIAAVASRATNAWIEKQSAPPLEESSACAADIAAGAENARIDCSDSNIWHTAKPEMRIPWPTCG